MTVAGSKEALETTSYEDFIAWLEAHHARVGVTPALREAYATYKANTRATLPPGAAGELVGPTSSLGPSWPWRCDVTGNPVGTDTIMVGAPPCNCQGCRAANRVEALSTTIEALKHEVASAGALRLRMEAHKETARAAVDRAMKAENIIAPQLVTIDLNDAVVRSADARAEAAESSLAEAQLRIAGLEEALRVISTMAMTEDGEPYDDVVRLVDASREAARRALSEIETAEKGA